MDAMADHNYISVSEVATYGKDVSKYFTKEHATRGILVHSLCEAMIRLRDAENELRFLKAKRRTTDDFVDTVKALKKNAKNTLDTCKIYDLPGFCVSTKLLVEVMITKPLLQEVRLFDPDHELCGKLDFFGYIDEESEPGIVDFKTSHNTYPEWSLQLAGYWHLCERNGLKPGWAATIRLRRHGKPPIINKFLESPEQYFLEKEVFMDKLEIAKRKRNDK